MTMDLAQKLNARRSPRGRLTLAQQFTAGDEGMGCIKSVKRTADPVRKFKRSLLMQFQSSVSRPLPMSVRDPSDESLGYCHSSAMADSLVRPSSLATKLC